MKDFLKRLFGKKTEEAKSPAVWNLTIAELMKEVAQGKRKSLGTQELEWARAYEKSLIPEGYRFPKQGDLYESLVDQEVTFLISRIAPYTDSGKATLFAGDRIWVDSEPVDEKPLGVYALPVAYKTIEQRIITEGDRTAPDYDGFHLSFTTIELNEKFRLVETRFTKEKYM